MIEVLAAIGLIILYFLWLLSPFYMFAYFSEGDSIIGRLITFAYVSGALVVGYVLFNFVGIW